MSFTRSLPETARDRFLVSSVRVSGVPSTDARRTASSGYSTVALKFVFWMTVVSDIHGPCFDTFEWSSAGRDNEEISLTEMNGGQGSMSGPNIECITD